MNSGPEQCGARLGIDEPVNAERALEVLAKRLFDKMNRLDPGDEESWDELSELDRHFYRACVEAVLMEPEFVRVALTEFCGPQLPER